MKVLIKKTTRKINQSGLGQEKWSIIFPKKPEMEFLNPVMGWTSSEDVMQEVNLSFSSKEMAIDFAKGNGWSFEEIKHKERKIIKKSYADNFI